MEMHAAATAPHQPAIREADRAHPLFPLYQQHRSFCSRQLIEASAFEDWKFQHEAEKLRSSFAARAEYPDFMRWMRANQGGARACPAGTFPENFIYWINGGRW